MHILLSSETTPIVNAAIEERLFRATPLKPTLLFYRNSPAALLGRNQNPWQECNLRWCRNNGVAVLRRISGGGTVYHDFGNLNYAFIVERNTYNQQRYLQCIIDALHVLGIADARLCEHFSIWVGEHKVAGSAFALSGQAALLHGCILVNSDLQRLRQALHQDPRDHFTTATVASVRVPVKNLRDINDQATTTRVQDAIGNAAQSLGFIDNMTTIGANDFCNDNAFTTTVNTFASDAWTFSRTADFTLERQCPSGCASMDVSLGRIRQAIMRAPNGCHNLPQLQGLSLEDACDALEQLPPPKASDMQSPSDFAAFP